MLTDEGKTESQRLFVYLSLGASCFGRAARFNLAHPILAATDGDGVPGAVERGILIVPHKEVPTAHDVHGHERLLQPGVADRPRRDGDREPNKKAQSAKEA